MKDAPKASGPATVLVLVGVVIALVAILIIKSTAQPSTPSADREAPPSPGTSTSSITSARNDASADYEAAIESGKPVYVLFHSLTCEPCLEISGVADQVLPVYRGRIVFVNAVTDDESARHLAARFSFQYIPTSFFLSRGGEVVGSHTGVLSAEEMRARLDELLAK